MVVFIPMVRAADMELGRDAAVSSTEFSPTLEKLPRVILLMSPLSTALYQMEAYLFTETSPMTVAEGAIQLF